MKNVPGVSKGKVIYYDKTDKCIRDYAIADSSIEHYGIRSSQPNQLQFSFDKSIEKNRLVGVQITMYFYEDYEQAKRFAPMQFFLSAIKPNHEPDKDDIIGDYNWEFDIKGVALTDYTTIILYSNVVIKYSYHVLRYFEIPQEKCQSIQWCHQDGKKVLMDFIEELEKCQTK